MLTLAEFQFGHGRRRTEARLPWLYTGKHRSPTSAALAVQLLEDERAPGVPARDP